MDLLEKTVLGVMSGTSLDGVDLAMIQFIHNGEWDFSILNATTIPYPEEWLEHLKNCVDLSKKDLATLDHDYTLYLAKIIQDFLAEQPLPPDFVSSHGHTVLHQPENDVTYQIGNLALLAKTTGHKVICDFRVADVALGGQGAPLVPGGEVHLFSNYAACVNLGGFANITLLSNDPVVAFDICPVNIVMNALVQPLGLAYDNNGDLAKSGQLLTELLDKLNRLEFYQATFPKSLGIEWVKAHINPLLNEFKDSSPADILHTFCHHIADQIVQQLPVNGSVLCSGGGCYNTFLISLIKANAKTDIVLPSKELIEYKEAVIFGFLGVLKELNLNNCLASVTGAQFDHASGEIFFP
ncbi:MAG: anhydro-N-acetylmuramic acid kinase [Candidatus Arcticimaribacter sp.]